MSKTIPKNNSKARKGVIKKYKGSHAESGRLEGGYEVSPHGPHRPSVAGRVGPLVLAGCGLADADIHRADTCGESACAGVGWRCGDVGDAGCGEMVASAGMCGDVRGHAGSCETVRGVWVKAGGLWVDVGGCSRP
jgi:hypothetical protein